MITDLEENEIFVFGSNLLGHHGAGAALQARIHFGAEYGIGVGMTGQCYAIPTKDRNIETLPINKIKHYVDDFLQYAKDHPELMFLVTAIGCGLAGYSPEDIAPLFKNHTENVVLPKIFDNVLISNS